MFNLNIRKIDNSEIPNLFGRSHYFVLPYQDIAQSGSIVVGLNYNKPIIASDLEAFHEYVKDGETGFFIKPASVNDLTNLIVKILKEHNDIYPKLVKGIIELKSAKFSKTAIVKQYLNMFNSL